MGKKSSNKVDWDSLIDLPDEEVENKAKEILSNMTTYQKVYQR